MSEKGFGYYRYIMTVSMVLMALLIAGTLTCKSAMIAAHRDSGIIAAANGTADKPFVFRALVPQVSNFLVYITPDYLQDKINGVALKLSDSELIRKTFSPMNAAITSARGAPKMLRPDNLYRLSTSVIIAFICLLVYGVYMRKLVELFFPAHKILAYIMPIYAMIIIIPFVDQDGHVYDMSVLAFCTMLLYYMQLQQWYAYIFLFTLACFNKETALLTTFIYAAQFHKSMDRKQFFTLLLYQLLIWGNSQFLLREVAFPDNPSWIHPDRVYVFAQELERFNSTKLLQLLSLWLLLYHKWDKMPLLMRQAAWFIPMMVLLYLGFGMIREYRVFYETYPFVAFITGFTLFYQLDERRNARLALA